MGPAGSAARRWAVVGWVTGLALAAPGAVARAAEAPAYAYDAGARVVNAASATSDAVRLEAGGVYRSGLVGRGKAYFKVELDARTTTYVSVTAVPGDGEELSFNDGVKVALQDANGLTCSSDSVTFGSVVGARPITAWAVREVRAGRSVCQDAGTYYVVVERAGEGGRGAAGPSGEGEGEGGAGDAFGSSSGTPSGASGSSESPSSPGSSLAGDGGSWGLEVAVVGEPPVGRGGATVAPKGWSSATPSPLEGEPRRLPGGAGFATATDLEQGAWRDDILPGQTLFYAVPVEWGQQVYVAAELGSGGDGSGYVASALDVTLYNPVRAKVDDLRFGYDGEQKAGSLRPLAPVAYANRYSANEAVSGMRFAGGYYLAVHLSAQVGEKFGDSAYGVTLRVRVEGAVRGGPGYRGESVPGGLFGTGSGGAGGGAPSNSGETRAAGAEEGSGGGVAMVAVAAGGFGAGTLVLVVLGVWTFVGRRRAGQMRVRAQKPIA
ncbi:hypothetical protein PV682_31280 [Streptomyces niveiscabiei]|uniref:hypothetical protein n=1 Tax=Streptomyces niveiscabiei TaxID=164115 RepID=UPI0029B0182C|nr:hypothetical protein [Streptomyces niveiscabiei]MDX3385907.1 hypothetical protein [Streptomyces niveiscabiei]